MRQTTGTLTGEPCILCGGEGATANWELCPDCRQRLQERTLQSDSEARDGQRCKVSRHGPSGQQR